MAMQQVQLNTQTHSAGWLKIFPRDTKTLARSTIFVKQLTALAFSCITYMRSIFPEYAYHQKEIDDVQVKVLSGSYDCKDAYLMTRWIKSAFDALDNKYMRELILEILSTDNKPLEYYAVVYKYNEDGPTCSFSANTTNLEFDPLKLENATKELIKTLLTVTESLGPLPKHHQLQLRVNYYEDVTPTHYKPKYFNHAKPCDFLEKMSNMKHKILGSVETPYLAMSMYSGSSLVSLEDSQQSFFKDMTNENVLGETENKNGYSAPQDVPLSATTSSAIPETLPESEWTWSLDKSENSEVGPTSATQIAELIPDQMNCICGHTYEGDRSSTLNASDTFKCALCESLHHMVCYKKIPGCKEIENDYCYTCFKLDNKRECADASLIKYKPRQAKHLATYRQVIYRFQNNKTVSLKTLEEMGLKNDLAESMISKLKQEAFIKPKKNSKVLFDVNKARVKHFIKAYFEL